MYFSISCLKIQAGYLLLCFKMFKMLPSARERSTTAQLVRGDVKYYLLFKTNMFSSDNVCIVSCGGWLLIERWGFCMCAFSLAEYWCDFSSKCSVAGYLWEQVCSPTVVPPPSGSLQDGQWWSLLSQPAKFVELSWSTASRVLEWRDVGCSICMRYCQFCL